MSDPHDESNSPHIAPRDLVAFLRGQASPEMRDSILNALKHEDSELSQWLESVEMWGGASFTAKVLESQNKARSDISLEMFIDFVRQKHEAGTLSDEDLAYVIAAGEPILGTHDPASGPSQLNDVDRMAKVLTQLHPEFSQHIKNLGTSRLR
jgi:hypothetical protein